MKICVTTVYNTINSGSFLQAYALKEVLEEGGNQVVFLKRKRPENLRYFYKPVTKSLITFRFEEAKLYIKRQMAFVKAAKVFKEQEDCSDTDCVIIGSDTIWNFSDSYFRNNKERYLGLLFTNSKVVSYAASVGNTPYEMLVNDAVIEKGLKSMSAISVRDFYTKEIVEKIAQKECKMVLDPTLLLSREEYAQIEAGCKDEGYILVYLFEKDPKIYEEITKLKKKTGKKIVFFGGKTPIADINVENDPFKFLYYFNHADMIITNTFHGTIFSVINKKPFANFGGKKKKVAELLEMLSLSGQICKCPEDMGKVLANKIDYDKVEQKLEEMRKQSKDFLFNVLKG